MNMSGWGRYGSNGIGTAGEYLDVIDLEPIPPEIAVTELDPSTAASGETLTPVGTYALIDWRGYKARIRALREQRRAARLMANQAGIVDEIPQMQLTRPTTWPTWAQYAALGVIGWVVLRRVL
jgi:hypothetical protein